MRCRLSVRLENHAPRGSGRKPVADTAAVEAPFEREAADLVPARSPSGNSTHADPLPGKKSQHLVEGVIQNISQSGVLFHGPQALPANALIEMVFEMPEEISGQKNSTVLCQGRLIRSKEAQVTKEGSVLAASILDYKFLRTESTNQD